MATLQHVARVTVSCKYSRLPLVFKCKHGTKLDLLTYAAAAAYVNKSSCMQLRSLRCAVRGEGIAAHSNSI